MLKKSLNWSLSSISRVIFSRHACVPQKVDSSVEGFRRLLDQNFALILLRVLPGMDHAVDLIKRLAKMGDIPLLDLSVV